MNKLYINKYSQPMHLFQEHKYKSFCGINIEEANAANSVINNDKEIDGKFCAAEIFRNEEEFISHWSSHTNYCNRCADAIFYYEITEWSRNFVR